ncbi:outer membrane protein assembly factor BamB [Roseivirga pacifica]|uniref:Outer membrane protein assembly factor BamB, contains PQQ-like beta-propeller repeat n=2 Tax=Roseivirga pacifica TaxID=1267423 RepID=A0A1I0QH04_9BACT|nr:outer membrane protein assembly factor BamB [Roseivirga pacifica]SEW26344.1 Outer membrane protein assembly factor BamB, contains PQQ-like beta-propeller repeat [Roseivirga pacifica]
MKTNLIMKKHLLLLVLGLIIVASCKKEDPENILPTASFSISSSAPETEETISFTDLSTDSDGEIESWSWDFGNGSSSTEQNPSTIYTDPGKYTISLTVTDNRGGVGTKTQELDVIDGNQIPNVAFGIAATSNIIETTDGLLYGETSTDSIFFKGMELNFTDNSSDDGTITSYSWDFGDGTTSDATNPTHTYSEDAKTYEVTLSVTDDEGAVGTYTKKVYIAGLKWTFLTNSMETASPSVDDNGDIYIGDRAGYVYKINKDNGTAIWTFEAGERVRSSVTISDDGQTVYVGSNAEKFYAIDAATGAEKWSVDVTGQIDKSSAALDVDGNLYVGTGDGILYSFDASGNENWTFDGGHEDGGIQSSPIYYNNMVFVAIDSMVYGVNASTGEKTWGYDTNGDRYEGHFVIDDNGYLYGGSEENDENFGYLYALNTADGSEIWQRDVPGEVRANSPILGEDGGLYISTEDGDDQASMAMYKLDAASGAQLWESTPAEDDFKVGGTLGATGTIYIGSNDDHFYLVDSETGGTMLKFRYEDADHSTVPVIGTDGTVYFGNRGSFLYALSVFDNEALPVAGWPTVGGNAKHQDRK